MHIKRGLLNYMGCFGLIYQNTVIEQTYWDFQNKMSIKYVPYFKKVIDDESDYNVSNESPHPRNAISLNFTGRP